MFYSAAALGLDPLPAPPCLSPSLPMHLCHVSHLSFPHNLSIYVCRCCCRVMASNSSSAAARKSQVAVAIALQSVNNKEASNANCE